MFGGLRIDSAGFDDRIAIPAFFDGFVPTMKA
jgi:hypothetical protein